MPSSLYDRKADNGSCECVRGPILDNKAPVDEFRISNIYLSSMPHSVAVSTHALPAIVIYAIGSKAILYLPSAKSSYSRPLIRSHKFFRKFSSPIRLRIASRLAVFSSDIIVRLARAGTYSLLYPFIFSLLATLS